MSAHQRVNVTLSRDTLRLLDRVAPKGARSRVVDDAVRFFIEAHGRKKLARLLRAGARARAARDRALAEEWFALSDQP